MSTKESDRAKRRIATFEKKFGSAHLYLAYHAAFPMTLTPDLLYSIWANFPYNNHDEFLNIPWIAVADLLLSSLCKEIEYELFEIEEYVRKELLQRLKTNVNFENRIEELASFLR